jgi:hypothetical protein
MAGSGSGVLDCRVRRDRLWRVRKNHVWIDAQVEDRSEGVAELAFFYGGELLYTSHYRTRAAAEADAIARLRDLQRAGWSMHW